MKSQIITLLLVVVACFCVERNQVANTITEYEGYKFGELYDNNNTHVMEDNKTPDHHGYEPPCPDAGDITPCACTYDSEVNAMDLDCSKVESEDQLRQIFKADFPSKNFTKFNLQHNKHVTVLESSIFNGVSFEVITVYNNELEVIEVNALDSCYETATYVNFRDNKISAFPFDELSSFSRLDTFGISGNSLNVIPADEFNGITTLRTLYIQSNTPDIVGSFENLPNLRWIHIGKNDLNTIPTNFINTGSSHLALISLTSNYINSVEPGAFDMVEKLTIELTSNSLSTIEETTWRPLFKAGVNIFAGENPLLCGCDIAWLFGEDQLLGQVSEETTCVDGAYLHKLDPSIFDDC
ncbi:unnamed protein product [Meganyctiphanes norvegica]|uniref:Oplophorus-luciferin 2-monooxygenase non-catalytic subunit n=1 Tax=Meganyctiphanes norvegica TaxID=48144 RepID=A0AAV2SPP8_MEGNR